MGNIVSTKDIKRFIDVYAKKDNWHNLDKSSGNLGYGWIHYSLIRNLKPERVLVIGSRYGYIPAICAMGCRHNKRGIVDFVDPGFDGRKLLHYKKDWGGVGFWKKADPKKHFGEYNLDDFIKVHVMTSRAFRRKNKKVSWGYIYLDGDHSYNGVKSDFNRFWPRLENGGFLALHDLNVRERQAVTFGVWKFWQELKEKSYSIIELPGEYGLGLIQKR